MRAFVSRFFADGADGEAENKSEAKDPPVNIFTDLINKIRVGLRIDNYTSIDNSDAPDAHTMGEQEYERRKISEKRAVKYSGNAARRAVKQKENTANDN